MSTTAEAPEACKYRTVVLGGTFDRLHAGHERLLAKAAELAQETVLVGVTAGEMNSTKELHEMIQPLDVRCAAVSSFLQGSRPGLAIRVEPIYDAFGPTATMEGAACCLVVSAETRGGGDAVNKRRAENGLPPIAVSVVELVGDKGEGKKLSSSTLRRKELELST